MFRFKTLDIQNPPNTWWIGVKGTLKSLLRRCLGVQTSILTRYDWMSREKLSNFRMICFHIFFRAKVNWKDVWAESALDFRCPNPGRLATRAMNIAKNGSSLFTVDVYFWLEYVWFLFTSFGYDGTSWGFMNIAGWFNEHDCSWVILWDFC